MGLVIASSAAGVLGAPASSAAACTSTSGVTVVVDYGSLGGTSVGCVPNPSSGIAALQGAGHSITYVPRQPGLVCTIDRRPDPCNGAPAKAYWSYWRASPGGSWSYSTTGAGSTHPKNGTVEGWAFGAGKPPGTRPPAAPQPKPTSKPKPTTSTSTSSKPTSSTTRSTTAPSIGRTAGGGAGSATSPAAGSVTTARPTSSAGTPGGTGSPTAAGTTQALTATRTDAAVPTSATSDSGGKGTLVVTAALLLLLAGGGGVIAWRRRGSGA